MNNRRDFIKKLFGTTAAIGLTGISSETFAKKDAVKITILHTNDVHSHVDPFPDNDPKYAGLGGAARRAGLINAIRAKESNVLLLDSGDIFQGTPYFNKYGGELEMKLMSMMKYDASTMGNHDFDNGIEGFATQLPNANFPIICSNYDFNNTALKGKTITHKVFEKDGINIGVFGLGIEFEGLVSKKNYEGAIYQNPIEKAAEYSHLLKNDLKCDLIVCLSHLGYKYPDKKISDLSLAQHSKNIDLFIGAHTHTFLEKPHVVANRDNKEVFVVQAGWAGINLGRLDFVIEKKSRKKYGEGLSIKVSNNARA